MRFATVGSGRIVERFLETACTHPEFEHTAVYSRTEERAREFAADCGISRIFTSIEDLAACPEVDAVYIASPNLCHAAQALTLMKAGKHILCEKPMATTYTDCDGMVLTAHNSRVILLEAMRPLFAPGFRKLYELLPQIGTLRRITADCSRQIAQYHSYKAGERPNAFDLRLSNAAVASFGSVCIAPTIAMVGEPQQVASFCTKLHEYEAHGTAIAKYEGFVAEWRWSQIADSAGGSELQGERGSICIGDWEIMSPLTLCLPGEAPQPIELPESDGTYEMLDTFIGMVKRRGGSEGYLSISLATTRVLDEIRRQNKITFRDTCWNPVVLRDD